MDEKARAFGEKITAVIESTCVFGILDENYIFQFILCTLLWHALVIDYAAKRGEEMR